MIDMSMDELRSAARELLSDISEVAVTLREGAVELAQEALPYWQEFVERAQAGLTSLANEVPWPDVGSYGRLAIAGGIFVALFIVLRMLVKKRRRHTYAPLAEEMLTSMRRQHRMTLAIIVLFFGGFVGWASYFELASGAVAPGVVSPEGSRRPVQHLEGGIVAEVMVKDGDHVEVGQPLIVLQEVRARSQVEALTDRRDILRVRLERLLAERDGKDFQTRPGTHASADLLEAVSHERERFESRRQSFEDRQAILDTREAQLLEEIKGLNGQIAAAEEQAGYLGEELEGSRILLEKGLEKRSRYLSLQRELSGIHSRRSAAVSSIARARQSIAEVESQRESLATDRVAEIDLEISDVRGEIVRLNSEVAATEDVLERTVLSAPASGVVVGLKVTSAQAVVAPGDVLLEIVPEKAQLLVDVHISPMDIDDVHLGQTAQVHLLAYKQRHMPRIEGLVRHVSADRYVDEQTGAAYYLAHVEVDAGAVQSDGSALQVIPGMPAEVVVQTGQQTFLDYLVAPLLRSLNRSFRES